MMTYNFFSRFRPPDLVTIIKELADLERRVKFRIFAGSKITLEEKYADPITIFSFIDASF